MNKSLFSGFWEKISKIILKNRIFEARKKPVGLGRQIQNAKPNFEPKRIFSSKKSRL